MGMSSYQKLKAKNKELTRILNVVCFTPESAEAKEIMFNCKLQRECEDAVMFGRTTLSESFTSSSGMLPKTIP